MEPIRAYQAKLKICLIYSHPLCSWIEDLPSAPRILNFLISTLLSKVNMKTNLQWQMSTVGVLSDQSKPINMTHLFLINFKASQNSKFSLGSATPKLPLDQLTLTSIQPTALSKYANLLTGRLRTKLHFCLWKKILIHHQLKNK